jgi:hypothetical protein
MSSSDLRELLLGPRPACSREMSTRFVQKFYLDTGGCRRCQPRDVLSHAIDLIQFERLPFQLTEDLLERASTVASCRMRKHRVPAGRSAGPAQTCADFWGDQLAQITIAFGSLDTSRPIGTRPPEISGCRFGRQFGSGDGARSEQASPRDVHEWIQMTPEQQTRDFAGTLPREAAAGAAHAAELAPRTESAGNGSFAPVWNCLARPQRPGMFLLTKYR